MGDFLASFVGGAIVSLLLTGAMAGIGYLIVTALGFGG